MHFTLNESAIISARSRKGAEFSGTWLLDPHNLWVYNSSKPATDELPSSASQTGGKYTPEANISNNSPLKIAANSTAGVKDSYVTDDFINTKLSTMEVQLTADGNITVTSNVSIMSTSSSKLTLIAAKKTGEESYTGHVVINKAAINITGTLMVTAQGNITLNKAKLGSRGTLMIASGNQDGLIRINNSNISGSITAVSAIKGNIEITGGNINGTNSVKISACTTDGNATLSGVSVNAPDFNVTGSNITIDNTSLNISPSRGTQGINIGMGRTPAKTVVIKNSTLNTTGSTSGRYLGGVFMLVLLSN